MCDDNIVLSYSNDLEESSQLLYTSINCIGEKTHRVIEVS